jgi:lia operon protein LiaG
MRLFCLNIINTEQMKPPIFITVLVIFLFSGCNPSISQETLAEEGFNLDNVRSLEVRGKFCNVELNGISGGNLKMEAYIRGSGDPDKYEIRYEKRGEHVEVWIESPISMWGNIQSLLRFDVPLNVEIVVDNSSGNLKVYNIRSSGNYLETTSGNVETSDTDGPLHVKCTSGNLSVETHHGDLWAVTTSGNIKIRNLEGISEINATSGNINLENMVGNTRAQCSSGNITLNQMNGSLHMETSSGNIKGDHVLLAGDSEFRATSGNIRLDLVNPERELSFDLEAGSGNLTAAGNKGDDKLILREGGINIRGITSSGNQTYLTR